jgi:hypothetical protein
VENLFRLERVAKFRPLCLSRVFACILAVAPCLHASAQSLENTYVSSNDILINAVPGDLPSAPLPTRLGMTSIDLAPSTTGDVLPPDKVDIRPIILTNKSTAPKPKTQTGIAWGNLTVASINFLGVQHAFRLGTEQGTRDALDGPFLQGYLNAVGNLHGWADGDEFYVNYVGHPMEGAVSGFIWIHNDRRFRAAEIGKNSLYWESRMRAAAFSYLYSVQFEIGPVSEASIGKIQGLYPQQGFVDHIVTPVIGTGWILAEDTVDKYLITQFERRVQNPYLQSIVRGALNPSRSFANAMELRTPWSRDTRPSPWSGHLQEFYEADADGYIQPEQEPERPLDGEFGVPLIQVTMNVRSDLYWTENGVQPCVGGGGVATVQVQRQLQLVADVGGCKVLGLSERWSGDTLTYMGGTRWAPAPAARWSPFVQVLAGGMAGSYEGDRVDHRDAEKNLLSSTAEVVNTNNFTMKFGAGLDYRLHPLVALHLATFEYKHVWTPQDAFLPVRNGMSMSAGIVLR